MTVPDVSVIVVNFNGQRYLETCLSSIEQQDFEREIVLVDNASVDDSVAFVRERFPAVRLVKLERNLGFAGGNNAGARVATGRYLAFLNNDTRVNPSWLGALRRAIDGKPDVGFVTSRIVYMHDPTVIDSAGDCLTRSGDVFKRGHGDSSDRLAQPREVFGACGAACLFRRGCLLRLRRARAAAPARQVGGTQGYRTGVAQASHYPTNAQRVKSRDLGTTRAAMARRKATREALRPPIGVRLPLRCPQPSRSLSLTTTPPTIFVVVCHRSTKVSLPLSGTALLSTMVPPMAVSSSISWITACGRIGTQKMLGLPTP